MPPDPRRQEEILRIEREIERKRAAQAQAPPPSPALGLPEPGSFQPTPGPSLPEVPLSEWGMRQLAIPGAAIPTGILGAIPDVVNLFGSTLNLVPGSRQNPKIPFGSSDLRAMLGAPEPTNTWERLTQTLGGAVGPGLGLKVAKLLGLPKSIVEAVQPWLTAGPAGDAAMGGASWLGSEMAPGLGLPPAVGALAGPLGVAGAHRIASATLPKIGAGARGQQDILAADAQLGTSARALETEQAAVAQALDQAKERAAFQTRTATTAAEHASTLPPQALAPVPKVLTGVVGPTPPDLAAVGTQAQQQARAYEARLTAQAETGYRALRDQIGPRLTRMEGLEKLATGYKEWFSGTKKTVGQLFDNTEKVLTGDAQAPQVLLETLHGRPGPMAAETAQTGQGMPRGAGAMARTAREDALTPGETAAITSSINPSLAGSERNDLATLLQEPFFVRSLDPTQRQFVQEFLRRLQAGAPAAAPFWLARRMESALREQAYEGTKPIGTLSQGRARELYWAVSDDLRRFYQDTPEGQLIQPALRQAKDQYIQLVNIGNRTLVRNLLEADPFSRGKFVDQFIKRPPEELLYIRQATDPALWTTAKGAVMDHLVARAMGGSDRFRPERLASVDKALQQDGKIDVLFTDTEKRTWNAMVQDANALTQTPSRAQRLAQEIASSRDPSLLGRSVFESGKVDRITDYKAMTDSATYDQMVKGWMADFQARTQGLDEAGLAKMLRPLVAKNPQGVSPLSLILEQYPTAEAAIQRAVHDFDQATQQAARMTQGAAATKAMGAEAVRLQDEAGLRRLEPLQAQVAGARTRLAETKRIAGLEGGGLEEVKGWVGAGKAHLRTGAFGAALFSAFELARSGHPVWATAVAGGALSVPAFRWWTNNTQAGRRAIREGLPTGYAAPGARIGVGTEGPPPEEGATP